MRGGGAPSVPDGDEDAPPQTSGLNAKKDAIDASNLKSSPIRLRKSKA